MMNETINLCLPIEDAVEIQKIFDERDDPGFTIISNRTLSSDCVELEIMFDSMIVLWFLAKAVHMNRDFNQRMTEMIQQANNKIKEDIKNLKNDGL